MRRGWARTSRWIRRVRDVFREDPHEPLPREWVVLAMLISAAATWLGVSRDPHSYNPLLRLSADDFVLNILAAVALVGPSLLLTNVVARRFAFNRRTLAASGSLASLLTRLEQLSEGVHAAHWAVMNLRGERAIDPVPTLHHSTFARNGACLLRYLSATRASLAAFPCGNSKHDEPIGTSVSREEEKELVIINGWPSVGMVMQVGAELRELASRFDVPQVDFPALSALTACLEDVHAVCRASHDSDGVRLLRDRKPLAGGYLTWPEEYAAAAAGLATSIADLVLTISAMLPGHMRVPTAASRR